MKAGVWFLGLVFCVACGLENVGAEGDFSFKIVVQGHPAATIIIGKKATEIEKFAASELQKYVRKISGATLAIKKDSKTDNISGNLILIGNKENNNRIAQLGEKTKISPEYPGKEGFVIRVIDNNLVLAGSDGSGTLYSVYDLLETLGCRWFFPEVGWVLLLKDGWEIIPREKDVSISNRIKRIEKPAFKNREIWSGPGRKHYDWLAKNRGNRLVTAWGKWKNKSHKTYLRDLKKRGIECEVGLDDAIRWYLPVDKYFDKHPEYYALVNGKRIRDKKAQFCFSNLDAAKEVARNMCKFIEKYPEVAVIGLGITDERGGFCECDKCKALHRKYMPEGSDNHSGEYLFFANRVANLVAKLHPDKKIMVSGYEYARTIDAPVNIKAGKNLKLVFYLWHRDGARDINSTESSRNKYLKSELKKYRKIFRDENVAVSDYYYGMSAYGYNQPGGGGFIWPIWEVIAKDFLYFKQSGIQSVSVGSCPQFSYLLNIYLFSRFAWDADVNLDKLLDDFCEKSFETAAEPMRRYIDLLMKGMRNVDFSKIRRTWFSKLKGCKDAYMPLKENLPALLNQKLLKELEGCLKEAMEKAKGNEAVLKRIALVQKEFKYSDYYIKILDIKNSISDFENGQYTKVKNSCILALKWLEEVKAKGHTYGGSIKNLKRELENKLALVKMIIESKREENIALNPSAEEYILGKRKWEEKGQGAIAVNQPVGWNCYIGAGIFRWGSTDTESYHGKRSAFIEGLELYHWPEGSRLAGQKTFGAALIHGNSNGYTGKKAYEALPEQEYIVSFWIKAEGSPNVSVFVRGWNSEEAKRKDRQHIWVMGINKEFVPGSSWEKYEGVFTTKKDTKRFALVFLLSSLGKIYVDDVSISVKESYDL